MKVNDMFELINKIAPFNIAEEWDNCGLQVGNFNWEVKKVIIALDVSLAVMNAAKDNNCDLVLTHHPLTLQAEKSIDFNKMPGRIIEISAKHKINIISAHTNLDKVNSGLNDYFANVIGLKETQVLYSNDFSGIPRNELIGFGRVGSFKNQVSLKELSKIVKKKLALNNLRVIGNMEMPVKTIAVCSGSGGSLVDAFIKSNADVYITGDIKYHEARLVEENSKAIIDVGHFASEHIVIDLLFDKLSQAVHKAGINIEIVKFKNEKDPFIIV